MNRVGSPIPDRCLHENCNNCWRDYPQSCYPNWTTTQMKKCKIADAIGRTQSKPCVSHFVDVDDKGHFINVDKFEAKPEEAESTWKSLLDMKVSLSFFIMREVVDPSLSSAHPRHGQEPSLLRDFLGPCFRCWGPGASSGLQILWILISRDRFDIEPFFFSSFLNWIPSRFEADYKPGVGDSMDVLPSQYLFRWTSYLR